MQRERRLVNKKIPFAAIADGSIFQLKLFIIKLREAANDTEQKISKRKSGKNAGDT